MKKLNSSSGLPAEFLRRALELREEINELVRELDSMTGGAKTRRQPGHSPADVPRKRILSAAGRARIAEAQRLRWAKYNSSKPSVEGNHPGKNRLSPKGREKVSAAMKARWERYRAAKALGIHPL